MRHQNFHDWSPGYVVKVFCDMERVCGCDKGSGEGGGWMRVADVNMVHVLEPRTVQVFWQEDVGHQIMLLESVE